MRLKSQFQPVGFDSGKIEGQKLFFPFRHCWFFHLGIAGKNKLLIGDKTHDDIAPGRDQALIGMNPGTLSQACRPRNVQPKANSPSPFLPASVMVLTRSVMAITVSHWHPVL